MQDFITLGDAIAASQVNIDMKLPSSFQMDCEVHGNGVEALLNGKCVLCVKERVSKEDNIAHEYQIMKSKELAGIKSLFMNATFDNYAITNAKQQILIERLKAYDLKQNMVLIGKTGTGKTHLLIALIDKLIRQGKKCHYVKFYQLARIKVEDKKLFQNMLNCDFLVIDEFGVMDSDFKSDLLFEIVDMRYDDQKYIALISNLEAGQLTPSSDGKTGLSNTLYSRIKQNCLSVNCDWIDYRLKPR